MNTPPLLLGLALLFWGWQAGVLVAAAPMAALLEGSRWVKARWDFSDADFKRLWTLCVVLFGGAAVYAYTTNDGGSTMAKLLNPGSAAVFGGAMSQGTHVFLEFLQLLPFAFLPMVAAQAYGERKKIDLAVFSAFVRRRRRLRPSWEPPSGINVATPYFAMCLVSAAAANARGPGFYAGASALLCWALWPQRSRRFSRPVWVVLASIVVAVGFAGTLGMLQLSRAVESWHGAWVTGLLNARARERTETATAIGTYGRISLSGGIVMRVDLGSPADDPPLLRNGSFDTFRSPVWSASRRTYSGVTAEPDTTTWKLLPEKVSPRALTIHVALSKTSDLLSLPPGTSELRNLSVGDVRTNRFGSVNVRETPGFTSYSARYGPGISVDGPTNQLDLHVPPSERLALEEIARELKLAALSAPEKLNAIAGFFARNFQYTLNLQPEPGEADRETALSKFLLHGRAGHCEYFATATVLLLRQAGVPARYATGYAVDEPDRSRGKGFVVRGRHAHAWCLAYVDGKWIDFDTTPGNWRQAESQGAPFWEPLRDWFSRLWFEFSRWRMQQTGIRAYLIWIVIGAATLIVIRLVQKRQWRRSTATAGTVRQALVRLGEDSEFFEIERRLGVLGHVRDRGETHVAWLARLQRSGVEIARLSEVLTLHGRYRFDPAGLNTEERARLATLAREWLAGSTANASAE